MSPATPEREPAEDGEGGWSSIVRVKNAKGLHARAAASFVRTAERYDADIMVTRRDETVDGACIMDLLMLAAGPGCHILIATSGREAEQAVHALTALVRDGFGEDDEPVVGVTDG